MCKSDRLSGAGETKLKNGRMRMQKYDFSFAAAKVGDWWEDWSRLWWYACEMCLRMYCRCGDCSFVKELK